MKRNWIVPLALVAIVGWTIPALGQQSGSYQQGQRYGNSSQSSREYDSRDDNSRDYGSQDDSSQGYQSQDYQSNRSASRSSDRSGSDRNYDNSGNSSNARQRSGASSSNSWSNQGQAGSQGQRAGQGQWAGPGQSGNQGQAGMQGAANSRQFIREYDNNNDGYLSRSELPSNMRQNFNQLDRNSDGYISQSELSQHANRMAQSGGGGPPEVMYVWIVGANRGNPSLSDLQHAYEMLQKIDKDNDGYITRSELGQQQQKVAAHWINHLFTRLDQNSDDEISRDEAESSSLDPKFDQLDENGDGYLTRSELRQDIQQEQSRQASAEDSQDEESRR
jgi:Ca2+-binding EF-hand superfamily protein